MKPLTQRDWRLLAVFFGLIGSWWLASAIIEPIADRHSRNEYIHDAQKRIQDQGGWSVVEAACLKLAEDATATNHFPYFEWDRWHTHSTNLPVVINGLKPYSIRLEEDESVPVMTVRLGAGNTTYRFCVVCTNVPSKFRLPARYATRPTVHKVAEHTFEVY